MITNGIDNKINWPDRFLNQWKCDEVELGSAPRQFSSGESCEGCNVSVRYATGNGYTALADNLSAVDDFTTSKAMQLLGT